MTSIHDADCFHGTLIDIICADPWRMIHIGYDTMFPGGQDRPLLASGGSHCVVVRTRIFGWEDKACPIMICRLLARPNLVVNKLLQGARQPINLKFKGAMISSNDVYYHQLYLINNLGDQRGVSRRWML